MSKGAFHEAVVGGIRFEGVLSGDGPYVSALAAASGRPIGGVALGVSSLRRFTPEQIGRRPVPTGWYIVKYTDEVRVFLAGFALQDVERLRAEFGLVPVDGRHDHRIPVRGFYTSRAWVGLVRWVGEHPRRAARMARFDTYLPGWHDLAKTALAEAMPPRAPADLLH